jgi:GcrA cell cycle regulator
MDADLGGVVPHLGSGMAAGAGEAGGAVAEAATGRVGGRGLVWTREIDAALTAAWNAGPPAPQVALALSTQFGIAITANMVIGRAHRLALPLRGKARGSMPRHRHPEPVVLATTARGCEWIDGDPVPQIRKGIDPHCGCECLPGRPYCAEHSARAYPVAVPAVQDAA